MKMKNGNTVIKTTNLTIGYNQTPVLSDANIVINQGEVVTILGGSGCGKTTLMRHLIGLETPLAGEIFIKNTNMTKASLQTKKQIKKDIGVMFQSGALMSSLNLLENVLLPLNEHTSLDQKTKIEIALLKLMLVGLDKYASFYPSNISGGMVKRAAIARAMALDPSVIFLDEPSAGLDPITSKDLDHLILELAQNHHITFIIVTHELASIRRISDRAIFLNEGKVAANGSINDLANHTDNIFVKQFFNSNQTNHSQRQEHEQRSKLL